MLSFLDKNDIHKLKILKLLNDSNSTQTLDNISSYLVIDKRTVHSLINYIHSDILRMEAQSKIAIQQMDDGTIFFKMAPNLTLQIFLLYYLKKSALFIFCQALYNSEFTTSSQFAKDNYISLSTFKKNLIELRKILNSFDLKLNLNSKNSLIGEEKQIRHFYFYFFWINYQTVEWPFKDFYMKKIKQLLDKNFTLFAILPFSDTYKIIYWISITIMRVKQGFSVPPDKKYINIENKYIPFSKFHPIIEQLFQEFGISDKEIILREAEFLYFCSSLLGIFPIKEYANLDLTYSEYSLLNTPENITHIWIKEFCAFFSISISIQEYQYLQANLLSIFKKIIYLKGPSSNFNFLVSNIPLLNNYPYYFEQIEKFILHLKKIKHLKVINQADHHLIDFYVLISWEILYKKKEKLVITIQSSFSALHMIHLKKEIINRSTIPLDIRTTVSNDTLLIVSDIIIPKEFSLKKEFFLWNTFPTEKQFTELNNKLLNIYNHMYS